MAKIKMSEVAKHEATPAPAEKSAPAAEAKPAATGSDLTRLREIVLGPWSSQFETAVDRLEARIATAVERTRSELSELERRLEARAVQLEGASRESQHQLGDQLQSQSKLLQDSIRERADQLRELAERGLYELRETKLDRDALSGFLGGMSEQLRRPEVKA